MSTYRNHPVVCTLHPLVFLIVLIPLILFSPLSLPAQDELYFPPELTISVGSGLDGLMRGTGMVSREDAEEKSSRVVLTSHVWTDSTDLLPMIFFDQGSSSIPERYKVSTSSGKADDYTIMDGDGSLKWRDTKYYEILDIIGYRLRMNRSARIALEPGYSTEPGETEAMAIERAQTVHDYFVSTWRIDPTRIDLLPPRRLADTADNQFVQDEARRVTFYSKDPSILSQVRHKRYALRENEVFYFSVMVDPKSLPEEVAEIRLLLSINNEILAEGSIPGSPDSTIYRFGSIWYSPDRFLDREEGLLLQAVISLYDGRTRASKVISIPIDMKIDTGPWSMYASPDESQIDSVPLVTLPFFPSGTTELQPWQQVLLPEKIEQIRKLVSSRTTGPYFLEYLSFAEASEDTAWNRVEIATRIRDVRQAEEELEKERNRPLEITHLVMINPAEVNLNNMFDLIQRAAGEEGTDIEADRLRNSLRYHLLDERSEQNIDAFSVSRAESVADSIGTALQVASRSTTFVSTPGAIPYSGDTSPSLEILSQPELRFYERRVLVILREGTKP